jgi:beta-glucosidase
VQGCSKDHCAQAINAGIDMFMVPDQWRAFLQNTVAQVRAGYIPLSRIDDAVTRILRVKLRAGLFEKGRPSSRPLAGRTVEIGAPEHRAVAREAVRKSIVLLKNDECLLPLSPSMHVLVAGDGADNIGKQAGGWSLSWQGTGNVNADFPGATSIYEGIRAAVTAAGGTAELAVDGTHSARPDVAVVVLGENPYAEWHGDLHSLDYHGNDDGRGTDMQLPPPEPGVRDERAQEPASQSAPPDPDLALLQKLHQEGIPVVAVFLTGRVRGITPELEAATAFAVAWLPGTEGAGVADVLFRRSDGAVNFPITGKLPHAWPRTDRERVGSSPLFPYGYGLGSCTRR